MRFVLALPLLVTTVAANAASRQAAVNKAIEQTKSRQSPAMSPARTMTKPNQGAMSPGRNEVLGVERLNKLIRALDKTWILPRAGAKEPVGSNFQYKKTCASIYKARHGACQQLGFGIMCFNYCHERGERLSFRCQDASDAAYCRQSGTFETFLAKYRKDSYKAKAYVHQMISRCYSTAICNTQSGLLNSTIIDEDGVIPERTTKGSGQVGSLKLLTRPPNGSGKRGNKKTTTTTAQPEIEEMPDVEYETTERTTRKTEKKRLSSYKKTTPSQPLETTTRANIWDKFTVGQKARPTPKYIPFWQRLLSTTTKSPRVEDISKMEEKETAEAEETESTQLPEEEVYESTFVTEEPETQETTRIAESTVIQKSYQKSNGDKKNSSTESASQKHTFRPLPVTTPAPPGPEMIAFQKPGGGEQAGTAENGGNRRTSTNYNIRTRLLEQIPAKSMVPIDTLRNEHWKVNHFGISAAARPDDPLSILLG